jgi:acyl-CoA synthetase (AMP-forming)/AMP-acid ligase II
MQLKEKLPVYMLPRDILVLDRFPLNANGKYDRKALQLILEKKFGSVRSRAPLPSSAGDAV